MSDILEKTLEVSPNQLGFLQHLMSSNGFTHFEVRLDPIKPTAILIFNDDAEYMVFLLKGLVQVLRQNSNAFGEVHVDFMIEVEKKFGTYSLADEYTVRKILNIM